MNPAGQAAGASPAGQVLEEAQHRGVGRVDQVPTLDRVRAAVGQRVGHGVDDLPEGLRRVGGGNQQGRDVDGAQLRLVDPQESAGDLGEVGRAVVGEHLLDRHRKSLPGGISQHEADEGLTDGGHVLVGGRQHPPAQRCLPHEGVGRQAKDRRFQQHQPTDTLRIPQGQVDRDATAVAAANHGRRGGPQGLEQGGGVVGMLGDAGRVVGVGSLAAGAATPVLDEHPPQPGQLRDRSGPHEGRASCAVNTEDRWPLPVRFVVEPDAVDLQLGHERSLHA
jgi:hypothetical protein